MSTFTQLSTVANPSHESRCQKKIQVENRWKRQTTKSKSSTASTIVVNQQSKSNKQQNNKRKLTTYSNENRLYPLKNIGKI